MEQTTHHQPLVDPLLNSTSLLRCPSASSSYSPNQRLYPHLGIALVQRQFRNNTMACRGQLSKSIKELRILICQNSPTSATARSFVEKNYKELKTLNPKLPILIRESRGIKPQLWARYDMGVERGIKLEGLSEEQISKALQDLVKVGASLKG